MPTLHYSMIHSTCEQNQRCWNTAGTWCSQSHSLHLGTEDSPNVNLVGVPFSDLLLHLLLVLEGLVPHIDVSLQSEGEFTVSEHLLVD